MSVYKVPQDVEADDKLIAFLSMKQFIFVIIAVLLSFVAFQLGRLNLFFVIPFVPFIAVFAILGLYQRKDQPAEIYLLAMLGFYLKPHRRVWNQDGVLETVSITAPKTVKTHYSDGLTKVEVKSRLDRLSTLMDTRGWAAKNSEFQTNVVVPNVNTSSDRLISPVSAAVAQPSEVHASDDMLDISSNPTAQNFDAMMAQAAKHAHDDALAHMHDDAQNPTYNPKPVGIHQKVLSPVSDQSYDQNDAQIPIPDSRRQLAKPTSDAPSTSTMTPPTSDAILGLANRRDDNLSVETIAKEAERMQSLDNDETIALH